MKQSSASHDPAHDEVTDDLLADRFDGLVYRRNFHRTSIAHLRRRAIGTTNGAPKDAAVSTTSTSAALLERIARDEGSSKAAMVELRGFEPLTPSMRTRRGRHRALLVGQLRLRTHLLSNLAREPMANLDIAMRRTRPDRSTGTPADGGR